MTADDIHIGVIGSLRCSGPPHENPWLNSHHSHLSHHGSAMIRLSFSESNEPTHSDFLFGSCAKFGAAMRRFLLGHGLRLRVLQPQTVQTTSSQGTLAKSTSQGSAFHGLLLLFSRCLHTHVSHVCIYVYLMVIYAHVSCLTLARPPSVHEHLFKTCVSAKSGSLLLSLQCLNMC